MNSQHRFLWLLSFACAAQALVQGSDRNLFVRRQVVLASPARSLGDQFESAVVDVRFGKEVSGIAKLRALLVQSKISQKLRRRAQSELASALEREGDFRGAAIAWEDALKLVSPRDPERRSLENNRALDKSLGAFGAQAIEVPTETFQVQATKNPFGTWNVPVEVNGVQANWIFDTGANISVITESEAARMGVEVRESNATVRGSTGADSRMRVAVARDLQFGRARLRNVVLLVVEDAALRSIEFDTQIQGYLGLPVIRALECLAVSSQGLISIGKSECDEASRPNLAFDGLSLYVEAQAAGGALQLLFDTGANETEVYPSARKSLGSVKLRSKREMVEGVGGQAERRVRVVPRLALGFAGTRVEVMDVSMTDRQPAGNKGNRDGAVGTDALPAGFRLDFNTMQFRVEATSER